MEISERSLQGYTVFWKVLHFSFKITYIFIQEMLRGKQLCNYKFYVPISSAPNTCYIAEGLLLCLPLTSVIVFLGIVPVQCCHKVMEEQCNLCLMLSCHFSIFIFPYIALFTVILRRLQIWEMFQFSFSAHLQDTSVLLTLVSSAHQISTLASHF